MYLDKGTIDKSITSYRNKDFRHQNLDGMDLSHMSFMHCDFRGTNLTENNLVGTRFKDCLLTDACFCESDLSHASFVDCDLTKADFACASLEQTFFNSEAVAYLNLKCCKKLSQVIIRRENDMAIFSSAPLVVKGLPFDFIVFDDDAKIGDTIKPISKWLSYPTSSQKYNTQEYNLIKTLPLFRPHMKYSQKVS